MLACYACVISTVLLNLSVFYSNSGERLSLTIPQTRLTQHV